MTNAALAHYDAEDANAQTNHSVCATSCSFYFTDSSSRSRCAGQCVPPSPSVNYTSEQLIFKEIVSGNTVCKTECATDLYHLASDTDFKCIANCNTSVSDVNKEYFHSERAVSVVGEASYASNQEICVANCSQTESGISNFWSVSSSVFTCISSCDSSKFTIDHATQTQSSNVIKANWNGSAASDTHVKNNLATLGSECRNSCPWFYEKFGAQPYPCKDSCNSNYIVHDSSDTGSDINVFCDTDCTKLPGYMGFLRYIVNTSSTKMCVKNCGVQDLPNEFGKKDPQSSSDATDYKTFYFMD